MSTSLIASSYSKMIMYTVAEDHMGDNEIAQVYSYSDSFMTN